MGFWRNMWGFDLLEDQVVLLKETLSAERQLFGEQVDYHRAQISQKQRRIDELQEALIKIKTPIPRPARSESDKHYEPTPIGWDALRAFKRAHPPEEIEPERGYIDLTEKPAPTPPAPEPEPAPEPAQKRT